MRNSISKYVISFGAICAPCMACLAEETIDLTGTKAAARDAVYLSVIVSSDKNLGYLRQSSNYGNGKWILPQEVACGNSIRYFEVWSKRNFGKIPAPSIPGLPSGNLKAVFALVGTSAQNNTVIERSVKGTMKRDSHWKDQDFSVRINLACGNVTQIQNVDSPNNYVKSYEIPVGAAHDDVIGGKLAANEYAEVTYVSGRWYTHPHSDAGTNDPANWHGPAGNGIRRVSGVVEGALFVQGVPLGKRVATQSKTFDDEKSIIRIDGPCFIRMGSVDDVKGDNTGIIKVSVRIYHKI